MRNIIVFFTLLLIGCTSKVSDNNELRKAAVIDSHTRDEYEAFGKKYMISTQGEHTTKAAKFVLDKGGNLFDAAVAASFAISVERPHSTGIGGGGFMLIHHKGETIAFDFREMAPRMAYKKMFLDANGKQLVEKSLTGPHASGTPGLVAGVIEVHKKYGSLDLATVMKPAIKLADKGFKIYPALARALKEKKSDLCRFKSTKKIFMRRGCTPRRVGETLFQKDLAKTLRAIAKNGHDGFYKGSVGSAIVSHQKETGGLITQADLDNYKVKLREPVYGTYRGYKIASMPPPSSGGAHIIQILNILENFDLNSFGAQSSKSIHLTSTAMQIAFADRAQYLGDADFVDVPIKEIISKDYAKGLAKKVTLNKALPSKMFPIPFKEIKEPEHTTHFTMMDNKGTIITSTQTINGWFGSSVVIPGTGIVMNNEMDDFASHVGGVNLFGAIGGKNNLVEPRKRPLSSMSPTIVFDQKGNPMMALGTPSGTRILTCVMQTVLNTLEYDMSLWDAVSATRYHHQWAPEEIRIEAPYFDPKVEKELKDMGHKINHKMLGCKIQAIRKYKDGTLHGVSDPREEGRSFGI